jgi:hypothetical protein
MMVLQALGIYLQKGCAGTASDLGLQVQRNTCGVLASVLAGVLAGSLPQTYCSVKLFELLLFSVLLTQLSSYRRL